MTGPSAGWLDETWLDRGDATLRSFGLTRTPELVDRLRREHPALADLVVGVVFGAIYPRGPLTAQQRQLVTLGCLIALGDVPDQLRAHAALALAAGLTPDAVREAILHAAPYAGFPRAISATLAVASVLDTAAAGEPAQAGQQEAPR